MHFGDSWVSCGGIAAVATAPGQRYQNLVTRLLTEALKEMNQREVPFASLYPFSYPFYEKMGWAASHWQYRIDVDTSWLQRVSKSGKAKRFRMISLDRVDELMSVYNTWAENWNLSLKRKPDKLELMLNWPGHHWRAFVHEHGYMLWMLDRSTEDTLYVAEFAYSNQQALLDGLALLGQMDSQYKRIAWFDADIEPFLQLGMPHPKPRIERSPAMMTRIVNRGAFEKLLPKPLGGLRIADPLGVSGTKDGDIGPGEIVQLVTGFWQTPPANQPAQLHRLVAEKAPYCVEKF